MDKWDEDKLKEVVKKKQNKPKTDIVRDSSSDTLSLQFYVYACNVFLFRFVSIFFMRLRRVFMVGSGSVPVGISVSIATPYLPALSSRNS